MSLSGYASLESKRESQGTPEFWRKGFVFVCFSFKLGQCFHLKTAHKKMLTYKLIAEDFINLNQNLQYLMPKFWSVDLTPDFHTLLMTKCFGIYMQKIEESIHQNAHCQ